MKKHRFKAKPRPSAISAADIADAMELHGAEFRFSECGSLFVRGLQGLPVELRELFFNCDGAQLVAYIRSKQRSESGLIAA